MTSDAELVVEALRARANQRQRAATALSAQLAAKRAEGKDVRSGGLKVVDEMAASARLMAIADELAEGVLVIEIPEIAPISILPSAIAMAESVGAIPFPDPDDPDTVVVDGLEADVLPDHMVDEDNDEELEAVAALIDAETPDA